MKRIFAIYDKKVGNYFNPQFMNHLAEVQRVLFTLANDENHQFNKYSDDFDVYELGTFEESTGEWEINPKPVFIQNMSEFKNQEVPDEPKRD